MAEQMCQICKKNEITGAALIVSLRTSQRNEHVVKGPSICDHCIGRMEVLFNMFQVSGGDIAFDALTRPLADPETKA